MFTEHHLSFTCQSILVQYFRVAENENICTPFLVYEFTLSNCIIIRMCGRDSAMSWRPVQGVTLPSAYDS